MTGCKRPAFRHSLGACAAARQQPAILRGGRSAEIRWPLSDSRQCPVSRSCQGHSRHPMRVIRAVSICEYTPWLVIVDDLHVLRSRVGPPEHDVPSLIDTDRVLTCQVALALAWWVRIFGRDRNGRVRCCVAAGCSQEFGIIEDIADLPDTSSCLSDFPGTRSAWRDCCSPPVWPPPPLIEAPRRHQGWPVWIDPVVFRAIAISWNNIVIPWSRPYHGRRNNDPRSFMNDLCLPRPGFSTGRPEGTQYQGRSESACDGHHLHHASASSPESAKGLKARQANSLLAGLNLRVWPLSDLSTSQEFGIIEDIADLPDTSSCLSECRRPPGYFAWGCFRYFWGCSPSKEALQHHEQCKRSPRLPLLQRRQ
ncbi:hypothetical protein ABIB82_005191 [Bradyrhizobium sp. i1.8.4]